jgi:hypothetical protein
LVNFNAEERQKWTFYLAPGGLEALRHHVLVDCV